MQSTDRQFGIWRSRVFREFDKCAQLEDICPGATLHELFVDEPQGIAIARFHLFVPFREGSSALRMIPLTALEVAMHFDTQRSAQGEPQFPFCAPRVSVYQGATYLPRELRYTCPTTGSALLELPTLAHWSPSNTLVMILQDVVTAVQLSDPQPTSTTSDGVASGTHGEYGAHGTSGKAGKRLRMRKRDIYGAIYHCHEVDPRSGMLRPVPMLLQSGNIVLLMPTAPASASSKAAAAAAQRAGQALPADDDHVFVSDLFPLKDIARITPQRGKSITFFFKSQHTHCRTLLTPQTVAIVADIQRMIAAVGSKRAREDDASSHHDHNGNHHAHSHHSNSSSSGGGSGQDDGALAQLMSFLSPEHTEKAKEVSNKIVGKLSRWGSTVSRFFKGDDDGDVDMRSSPTSTITANRPRAAALQEIDRLKSQFFQYPSRAKMLEITTRYQQVAETLAQHNSRDGQVEKTIAEMQAFIEHPATQKLLLDAYAVDNSQRGIRVGSL